MSFNGKVVLVTGASSGIGADVAHHFATKLGAKVAIVGRNENRLNAAADEIKKCGGSAPLVITADVTKDASRIIDETIEEFGRLDVLINNAGYGDCTPILEADIEIFDRLMETNVRSAIILTKLATPYLEKTNGNVINVSSIAGIIPYKEHFYSISKAALNQFTKVMANELGPRGIRINAINPGFIKTGAFDAAGWTEEQKQTLFNKIGKKNPLGRIGEVADTTKLMAFLASEDAAFITGCLYVVDGGGMAANNFNQD